MEGICTDDSQNQNIFIQAMTKGWDSVKILNKQCPLWRAIDYVDRCLFQETGPVEKLALLRNVHLMVLVRP
jgi:hypothetical protein